MLTLSYRCRLPFRTKPRVAFRTHRVCMTTTAIITGASQGLGRAVARLLAAREHASRTLAAELEGTGVRVVAVDPGDMDTEMHRLAIPDADVSQLAQPESVAPKIVELAAA